MTPEINRLIELAQRNGYITPRQRETILNKARELGDDCVEVEFILDGIPVREEYTNIRQPYYEPKKKRHGKAWLWILLAVVVVGIVVAIVASLQSNDAPVPPSWDEKITSYDNGYAQFMSELSSTNILSDYESNLLMEKYQWLFDLETELDNAKECGVLTPEQSARYEAIEDKYGNQLLLMGIGAGTKYMIQKLFN